MKRNRNHSAPLVVAALLLVGCGDSGSEWAGTVTDSAGIEIVTNTADGMWASGEGWTVTEDVRIGTMEGNPELQFGQIAGLDVDSEGRIYVMDQQASEVRVFSPEGEFVTTMGKQGSGPGELSQGAGPVFVGAGDTVFVPDQMQQRVTRFTSAGEPAGSYPIPMTEGIAAKWMEAPNSDLLQQAMVMALPGMQDVEPKNLLLRRGPDGAIVDTVMEMQVGQTVSFAGDRPSITLFESEPMWAIGPDGRLVYGINDTYSFQVRDASGELRRIIRMPGERQPVTEGDQTEFRRILEDAWTKAGMPPQQAAMMREMVQFAEFYPAYATFFVGPAGSTWVQHVQTPETVKQAGGTFNIQDIGAPRWDVFDDEGRFLGTVDMPGRFTPMLFRDDYIYGVMMDDLDVQYAVRMRVDRGGELTGD